MNNPIGIFDSGVGGLTVWNELIRKMPNEHFVYVADSMNCPYGEKSQEEIIKLSIANVEFLLSKECKVIVVACNTATAAAIDLLRELYSIPFVGMEPAIKPAAQNTKTGRIGVLATKGTFNGRLFKETYAKYTYKIDTRIQIGDGLVELVEKNDVNSLMSKELLTKYLNPMVGAGVDKIVLGCTHYPFFIDEIKKIIPSSVEIINPAPAIAMRTFDILSENKMRGHSEKSKTEFYTNGDKEIISNLLDRLEGAKDVDYSVFTLPCTS